MDGIYRKILTQAFSLTKGHRVFWRAGLLLAWPNALRALAVLLSITAWILSRQMAEAETQPIPEGNPWIGLGTLFVVGLLLIFHFYGKATLILAVKQLQSAPHVDKDSLRKEVEPHVSGLIRFSLVSFVMLGLVLAFLFSPVLYLDSNGLHGRAEVLALLATLILIPIAGLAYCIMVFGPMFSAVHSLTGTDSARASVDVFRGNWMFLSAIWLFLLAVEIAGMALSAILFLVAALPFVLLSQIFYDVGGPGLQFALQALAGIASFVVFFISQGMVAAFQRVTWAVAFFEIVKPVKMDEEDPETVPEVIS